MQYKLHKNVKIVIVKNDNFHLSACSATQERPGATLWPSTGAGAPSLSPSSGWRSSLWWPMSSHRAQMSGLMGSLSGKCLLWVRD